MKLKTFRIRNFRSIVDSGIQTVSPDNINVLIGQNEAGKTSILKALHSFETGIISMDDIRSVGDLPEIYCEFQFTALGIQEIFKDYDLPQGLFKKIKDNSNVIGFLRSWSSINDGELKILQPEVESFWNSDEKLVEDIQVQIDKLKNEGGESSNNQITKEEFLDELWSNVPTFVLFEDSSLLPRSIDLVDIESKNTKVEGYKGALNFLKIIGFDTKSVTGGMDLRIIEDRIDKLNKSFTADFQKYWGQKIGKNDKISVQMELKYHNSSEAEKAGSPYLTFYIKDEQGRLYPDQRSQGIRWFLSFYLELQATAKQGNLRIFLIDEPGGSLHAKAQEDVLKVFEKIKIDLQIIYTTHSPYLIDINSVHRILAVQRDDADDFSSTTRVLTVQQLGSANEDTLFPLYTIMGVNLSHQGVIQKENNVLLEEISGYYYLKAFWKLFNQAQAVYFLPATGVSNIPLLANLMIGWGIDFAVVVDDEPSARKVYKDLKEGGSIDENKLIKIRDCKGIEDIFSKTDFKKFILCNSVVKYSQDNSEYVKLNHLPKPILARDFMLKVISEEFKLKDLSNESQSKINLLLEAIKSTLR
jgi:predicted ATP-dependent endonuclease of OLD family